MAKCLLKVLINSVYGQLLTAEVLAFMNTDFDPTFPEDTKLLEIAHFISILTIVDCLF